MIWEAADPYLYFRTDETGRIIAGGEDEDASDANADPKKLGAEGEGHRGQAARPDGRQDRQARLCLVCPVQRNR